MTSLIPCVIIEIESEEIMKSLMCPKCFSEDYSKKGWRKNKKESKKIRQYQCKACNARFTINSLKDTKKQHKPQLNDRIMVLYCEGNTLRGMARILGVTYQTIVRKWRFMAGKARIRHEVALQGEIVTKYIQFDQMETFEHTKEKPLGIALSIRPKTGQILSAKVCRIPIRALTIAKSKSQQYNKKTDRKEAFAKMLYETSQAINKDGYSVMACDGDREIVKLAKIFCPDSVVKAHKHDYSAMWRLNHTCAKLRHHLSRLTRKTWATTKDMKFLQMHLDLFIAYQNKYELF